MDGVLRKIDDGMTAVGRQVLYSQLRTYEADTVLRERARERDLLAGHPDVGYRIREGLGSLKSPDAKWLVRLVLQPLPSQPRHHWAFLPLSLACLLCFLGIPVLHPLLFAAVVLGLLNAVIHLKFRETIHPYFFGFAQVAAMIGTGLSLSATPGADSLAAVRRLQTARPKLLRLQKQLGWLILERASLPEPANSLIEYLNVFFLVDLIVFFRSIKRLRGSQQLLLDCFEAIGALDAAMAVAHYEQSEAVVTRPMFSDSRAIMVMGICHPLIPGAVGSSFSLCDGSAIVTGPNMAGKTTFIRTVAINLILARTLNLCLAANAILPRASVHSAIKREDDLAKGKSYFFAELDEIQEFIGLADGTPLCLFLIDEPFRGTNTAERVAISASVLRYLAKRHLVLASTHDVELQQLLAGAFEAFHFSDQIVDGNYGFDYVIRAGPASSRNAIHLLKIRGYPPSLIEEAEKPVPAVRGSPPPNL